MRPSSNIAVVQRRSLGTYYSILLVSQTEKSKATIKTTTAEIVNDNEVYSILFYSILKLSQK